ncbi:ribitol 5-phosphate transferase FKRP [Hydra vulgaris]|uniref:ribitol 5-phosphate transferase FKRP n=1 Tax=Hydra vulgaris TaxID=6087 RepID=UPI001F5E6DA5|nr:ribitol 5-phosphate transferase FKRP-like [Hydra vulgaris]
MKMNNKLVRINIAASCVLLFGGIYFLELYNIINLPMVNVNLCASSAVTENSKKLEYKNFFLTEELDCKTFIYDASEWTLTYQKLNKTYHESNNSKNEFKCKKKLLKLLNSNSVKRIVYSDKSVKNRGCTKSTAQCKEKAYFNYRLKKRINTPPCCREKLLEMLTHFTEELQALHVSHMLAFGSVIGWARNGKMVPYDTDIDLILDKEFWKTPLFYNVINKLETKYGYKTSFADDGIKFRISYSPINSNTIEAWPFEIIKRGNIAEVSIPHYGWKKQPLENLFPERYVSFDNVMTFVPRDTSSYLDNLYTNWRSELDCSSKENNKCVEKCQ